MATQLACRRIAAGALGVVFVAAAAVTPAATLKAMTTTAAELLRVQNVRGAIRKSFAADIIAIPEDPLANIKALRKVNFVMKNGVVVRSPEQKPTT